VAERRHEKCRQDRKASCDRTRDDLVQSRDWLFAYRSEQYAQERKEQGKDVQQRLATYRALTPEGRRKLLRECVQLGHAPHVSTQSCDELVAELVSTASSKEEAKELSRLGAEALSSPTTPLGGGSE
jgi:flagellar motility protein MotE (MotC chaperone)